MSAQARLEGANPRSTSRRSLTGTTLPQEYLDRLEEKRKQLDESIHKYIAAKEREYKHFQKELKQQFKLSQGQNGQNDVTKRHGSPNGTRELEDSVQLEAQCAAAVDAPILVAERREPDGTDVGQAKAESSLHDRTATAGLKDKRASAEREKDFLGLFTPDYLPALNARGAPQLHRSSSAPEAHGNPEGEPSTSPSARANSDSLERVKPKRPSHLSFVQRTSSSGESADGKLPSAMRSPTHRPKQKRVSLAVGDSIVAPSDSVPVALAQHTTSSHSRKRSSVPERDNPISTKRSGAEDDAVEPVAESSASKADNTSTTNATIGENADVYALPPAAMKPNHTSSPGPSSRSSRIDPDGDLFDLEDEDEDEELARAQMDSALIDSDDTDNVLEEEADVTGRVEPVPRSPEAEAATGERRYDPATGLIPEPEDKDEDSAVPYLAFGPSSAVAPTKPVSTPFTNLSTYNSEGYERHLRNYLVGNCEHKLISFCVQKCDAGHHPGISFDKNEITELRRCVIHVLTKLAVDGKIPASASCTKAEQLREILLLRWRYQLPDIPIDSSLLLKMIGPGWQVGSSGFET